MSNTLPNPMRRLGLAAWLLALGANFNAPPLARSQPAEPRLARNSPAADAARPGQASDPAAQAAQQAQQLMRNAAREARQLRSVQANVRQRMKMFGHRIAGAGRYFQTGRPDRPMWFLDLKIQVGQSLTLHQEVSDGDVLWTKDVRPEQLEVTRVDLEAVRTELLRRGQTLRTIDLAGLGGLPRIMDSLANNYDFQSAQTGQLSGEPVWVVHGLRRVYEGESDELRHTPDAVQVILSRDEELPLFPYRIEYRHLRPADQAGQEPIIEPLLVTEWYSIQVNQKIDPRQFQFIPGDVEIVDRTAEAVQAISGGKAPSPSP